MKKKVKIIGIMVIAILVAFTTIIISKSNAQTLSITTDSLSVQAGSTFDITVALTEKVETWNMEVSYDSSLFTYAGTTSDTITDSGSKVSYVNTAANTTTVTLTFKANSTATVGSTGIISIDSIGVETSSGEKYAGGDEWLDEYEDKTLWDVTELSVSSITITIADASSTDSTAPTITPSSLSLVKGETSTVTADEEVTWSSGDTSIVTVDSDGNVTAVGVGITKITATDADGNSSSITVTVTNGSAPVVSPTSLSLKIGETETLTADKDVTWSSSDTSVATVDSNGKVTAVGVGTATITATDANGNTTTVTVTVTDSTSGTLAKTGENDMIFFVVTFLAILAVVIATKSSKLKKLFDKNSNDIN